MEFNPQQTVLELLRVVIQLIGVTHYKTRLGRGISTCRPAFSPIVSSIANPLTNLPLPVHSKRDVHLFNKETHGSKDKHDSLCDLCIPSASWRTGDSVPYKRWKIDD